MMISFQFSIPPVAAVSVPVSRVRYGTSRYEYYGGNKCMQKYDTRTSTRTTSVLQPRSSLSGMNDSGGGYSYNSFTEHCTASQSK